MPNGFYWHRIIKVLKGKNLFKPAKFESKKLGPHLGRNGLAIFEKYVSSSTCYLEYGSGGSTPRAHSLGAKHIISVDSSKDWTQAIQNNLNHSPNADLLYCDIGLVGRWGKPTKEGKLQNYYTYMSSPWSVAQEKTSTSISSWLTVAFVSLAFYIAYSAQSQADYNLPELVAYISKYSIIKD